MLIELAEDELGGILHQIDASGLTSIAICLLHAYANPAYEQKLAELIAQKRPNLSLSLSSWVSPEVREFNRTQMRHLTSKRGI